MRTFVIRSRQTTTRWDQLASHLGTKGHIEIVAHSVMNAFFASNSFREDVEVYIVLDSGEDFPRTIKLSGKDGLSIDGFHEQAIINVIAFALKNSNDLLKDATLTLAPGIEIIGFGFEKLIRQLLATRTVYLLDKKGENIRTTKLESDPVFILSDHLKMPKNSVTSLKRQGMKTISLGKKMLFASQCVTIIHYELD